MDISKQIIINCCILNFFIFLTQFGKVKLKILLQIGIAFITIIFSLNILQSENLSKYSCSFCLLFNNSSFKLNISLYSLSEKNLNSFKNSLSTYKFLFVSVKSLSHSLVEK